MIGTAVVAGHVSDRHDRPGAMFNLSRAHAGWTRWLSRWSVRGRRRRQASRRTTSTCRDATSSDTCTTVRRPEVSGSPTSTAGSPSRLTRSFPEAHASRGLALATVHPGSPEEPWRLEFDAALRLRPGSFEALYLYGRTCLAEGRYVKAVELFEAAHKAWPDDFHTTMLLAKALRGAGDETGARVVCAETLAQIAYHLKLVADDPRALCDGFCALVELGRITEAMSWADQVGRPGTPDTLRYYVACGLARAGLHDRALAELTDVIDGGWSHARWLRHDPDWSILRDDTAVQALLGRLERPRKRAAGSDDPASLSVRGASIHP